MYYFKKGDKVRVVSLEEGDTCEEGYTFRIEDLNCIGIVDSNGMVFSHEQLERIEDILDTEEGLE